MHNATEADFSISVDVAVWLVIDGTICVIIVTGNLVTLCVLRSSLQFSPIVSSQFVMSLALSDMVVGATMPYHMAMKLSPTMAAARTTCVLKFVFILFGCCASILNMTAIAADRYFAIIHPFKYERTMNARIAQTVLFGGWVHAVIFATVPLYWNSWRPGVLCELGRVLPRYYTTAVIAPAFAIIWATMSVIYWRIWREASRQVIKLRQLHVSRLRQSCFQVVLLVMGCFTVCWLPFLVAACVQAAGHQDLISPTVYKVVLTLAISSSAVNPLIYAWKNSEFKRTFGHLVRCRTASHSLQHERSSMDKHPRNSALFIETHANTDSVFHELEQL